MPARLSAPVAITPDLIATATLTLDSLGEGLTEFTAEARRFLAATGAGCGLFLAYLRHTSASLLIQENADPDVRADLDRFFARLVPDGDRLFSHTCEGPDDMPAHVRAALTAVSLSIPFAAGRLALGTWQGIYLWEHRHAPHARRLTLHLLGA